MVEFRTIAVIEGIEIQEPVRRESSPPARQPDIIETTGETVS